MAGDGLNRARMIEIYLFTATSSTIVSSRMLCDSRYLVEPVDIRFSTLKGQTAELGVQGTGCLAQRCSVDGTRRPDYWKAFGICENDFSVRACHVLQPGISSLFLVRIDLQNSLLSASKPERMDIVFLSFLLLSFPSFFYSHCNFIKAKNLNLQVDSGLKVNEDSMPDQGSLPCNYKVDTPQICTWSTVPDDNRSLGLWSSGRLATVNHNASTLAPVPILTCPGVCLLLSSTPRLVDANVVSLPCGYGGLWRRK